MEKKVVRITIKYIAFFLVGAILACLAAFVFIFRPYSIGTPPAIPKGWGYGFSPYFLGDPATPNPIAEIAPPSHPYLSETGSNNMHVDSYASDVHSRGGPLGIDPTVASYAHGPIGGECASVTFDSNKHIVAVCATFKEFSLVLLDPKTLAPLAKYSLPPRASNKSLNLRKIMSDTSGGAYFYLDNSDKAVLVDAMQKLKVIGQKWKDDKVEFMLHKEYDLLPTLTKYSSPDDVVTAVLPDWSGQYFLFVSRKGLIGALEKQTGEVNILELKNEEIQNSFSVDRNGLYVISDRALYGISLSEHEQTLTIVWREEYQRAEQDKPGSLTRGSGSTPTLLGDSYIAITDNADPRINVLVYRRDFKDVGNRLVAKTPVFNSGKSATENTMIGIGKSLIVENNYGYDLFPTMMFGKTAVGGVARVDFDEKIGEAHTVWKNPIISQTTVPKLSLQNGLVYVYAKDPNTSWWVDAFYLAAIDFETGETVWQTLTGTGVSYDNNWAPITLGEDNSAYIGVLRGLVKVADGGNAE
ncbi:MAG: hypothetical protein AB2784_07900 [Candidatus Thiodiazotropha endolucinida]